MVPSITHHHLVVTASGEYHSTLLGSLLKVATNCQCNILDSQMRIMGNSFVMLLQLEGIWSAIAKVEVMLPQVTKSLGITLHIRRTFYEQNDTALLPYTAQITGINQTGIASKLVDFFIGQQLEISEFFSESFQLTRGKTLMFSITIMLNVPLKTHIANLRELFLCYCDERNIEGILEPLKPLMRAM